MSVGAEPTDRTDRLVAGVEETLDTLAVVGAPRQLTGPAAHDRSARALELVGVAERFAGVLDARLAAHLNLERAPS